MSGSSQAIRGLATLALILASSYPGPTAASEDDDFHVDSSRAEDYRGSKEEVESNVTDELAIKLRQFDEWTIKDHNQTAADAAPGRSSSSGASPSTEGTDASQEQQAVTASSYHAANGGSVDTNAKSASNSQSPSVGSEVATAPIAAHAEAEELPPSVPQPPPRANKPSQEDDVARIIREAAEQETDPDRKRALMEQYDAYIQNR